MLSSCGLGSLEMPCELDREMFAALTNTFSSVFTDLIGYTHTERQKPVNKHKGTNQIKVHHILWGRRQRRQPLNYSGNDTFVLGLLLRGPQVNPTPTPHDF